MATEILIQTNARMVTLSDTERRYIPQGAVITAVSDHARMVKWMEIAFDLASPANRHRYASKLPWFQVLLDRWTQEFRDAWFSAKRDGFFNNQIDTAAFWMKYVIDSGLKAAMGKDPRGQRDLMDTWIWGKKQKTQSLPALVAGTLFVDVSPITLLGADEITYHATASTIDVLGALISVDVTEEEYLHIIDPTVSVDTDFDRPVDVQFVKPTEAPVL